MKKFIYKNEYQLLNNAILNITDDCNLQCKYCFTEQHPNYMSLETAKAIVDYLYNNGEIKRKNKIISEESKNDLYFFGGEPMLQYKTIIKPIVLYCETKYPNKFSYGITTNGTLLTKEIINFFKKYNFAVMLSMDGIKESQDFNRPCRNSNQSSYDLIMQNVKYLIEQIPSTISRGTAYGPTIQYLFENYKFAEELGFKHWTFIPDQRHEWTKEQLNIYEEQINKIFAYRLNQIAQGILPMNSWVHNFWMKATINLLQSNNNIFDIENNCSVNRCGLGTITGSIGYDGSIYGCQEQPTRNNKNIFYIGNIFNGGIDKEKHYKLLNYYYNTQLNSKDKKDKCKNCLIQKICKVNTLICPSSSFDITNTMSHMTEVNCFTRQIYIKNCLFYLYLFSQCENKDFINKFLLQEIQNI